MRMKTEKLRDFTVADGTCERGTTLVELLVALTIFGILISLLYPTFSFINRRTAYFNDMQQLNDRGTRIIDYIAEDIKQAGYIIGPLARIPYCNGGVVPSSSNVIVHTDSDFANADDPYDSLTFITAVPIELDFGNTTCIADQQDCAGAGTPGVNENMDYYLSTCAASMGDINVPTDSDINACVPSSMLTPISDTGDVNKNGRSLVTFESVAPTIVGTVGEDTRVYYTVQQINARILTFSPTEGLIQDIPEFSTVYGIRQYAYSVDMTTGNSYPNRSLLRTSWDATCNETYEIIDDAFGTTIDRDDEMKRAGVDALQFEFIYQDDAKPVGQQLRTSDVLPPDLADLKAIRIWLLLRAETPDPDYTDTREYVLHSYSAADPSYDLSGSANNLVEFTSARGNLFEDSFRRIVLTKTVEVMNIAK